MGPSSKLDSICHDIEQATLPPIPKVEQQSKSWVFDAPWRIIDQKNVLRRLPGRLNQIVSRHLTRRLKASFIEDRKRRATTAGALVEAELDQGKIKEAWNVIRRWFISVEDRPLPPSREDLQKVTNDRIKLYSKSLPPD